MGLGIGVVVVVGIVEFVGKFKVWLWEKDWDVKARFSNLRSELFKVNGQELCIGLKCGYGTYP